ncbi:hypothetical protein [Halarcobacter sp.]|uniref:hypothetical protein n=1 Tax=Halarcobacter sp. TaxID=2321133 RepID=UPI0029F48AA3|nr:hypothetical protein [Halarcobacter sp.]
MEEKEFLNEVELNQLKSFVEENFNLIYKFINNEILKDVGVMNYNYYIKLIDDMFVKQNDLKISKINLDSNLFPYYIFTQIFGKGKMDYTSLRTETINLQKLNKQISVYYNYARFSLKDDFLYIDLMQTKIGGMPIDEDIVKVTKKIEIKSKGLEEFINKNKTN